MRLYLSTEKNTKTLESCNTKNQGRCHLYCVYLPVCSKERICNHLNRNVALKALPILSLNSVFISYKLFMSPSR